MRRWVIVILLGVGSLIGGYYLFHNTIQSQKNTSETSIVQHDETNIEQRKKELAIPKGQKPFFGKVTNVKDSVLTIQSAGMTKTLTIKLDKTTIYSGGKQSDITNEVKVAGIGKTNSDGSLTAVKLEIKPSSPTK